MFKRKKKQEEVIELVEVTNEVIEESEVIEEVIDKQNLDFTDFVPEEDSPIKDDPVIKDQIYVDQSEIAKENPKKDLNTFFEKDKKQTKKLKTKDKKPKKQSKRAKKKEKMLQDVKDRKLFKYGKKKYTKVEDFVRYLNEHYLDMDVIAKEVLDDEYFYGWVSKNSGIFEQSLKEFKQIKEKIEK